jgi:hypothetical protein
LFIDGFATLSKPAMTIFLITITGEKGFVPLYFLMPRVNARISAGKYKKPNLFH